MDGTNLKIYEIERQCQQQDDILFPMELFPITKAVPVELAEAKLLLMDTSSQRGYLGLFIGNDIVQECWLESARKHVSDLAPAIDKLLREAGWQANHLDAIAVGIGPGSYTGLRIGIMSARTLALVTGARLLGLGNFEIQAASLPQDAPEQIEFIADAQQDKLYRQLFRKADQQFKPHDALEIVDLQDWLKSRDEKICLSGPGVQKLKNFGLEPANTMNHPLITGKAFAQVALAKLSLGLTHNPHELQPLYMRRSSAEEQWDRRPPS